MRAGGGIDPLQVIGPVQDFHRVLVVRVFLLHHLVYGYTGIRLRVEGDLHPFRDTFRHPVGKAQEEPPVAGAFHPIVLRRDTQAALRGLGVHCHDAADGMLAVFVPHVPDDLLADRVRDVGVNIRHGHTLRVQEPLKQQAVLDRVQVCDTKKVAYQRPDGGSTSWPDPESRLPVILPAGFLYPFNTVGHSRNLFGRHGGQGTPVFQEILDDQVVVRVTHGGDYLVLMFQPLLMFRVHAFRVPPPDSLFDFLFQDFVCGLPPVFLPVGLVFRVVFLFREHHVTGIKDAVHVCGRLPDDFFRVQPCQHFTHFPVCLDIQLVVAFLQVFPLLKSHRFYGLPFAQFPRAVVNGMDIIGGCQRDMQLFGNCDQLRVYLLFQSDPVVLNLHEKIAISKNLAEFLRFLFSFFLNFFFRHQTCL